jgi:hypothetical protein
LVARQGAQAASLVRHGNALAGLVPMRTRAESKTVQVAVNTGASVVILAATPATRFV